MAAFWESIGGFLSVTASSCSLSSFDLNEPVAAVSISSLTGICELRILLYAF